MKCRERAQRNELTPRQRRIMQRLMRAGDRDPPVSLTQITFEVERMLDETIETALRVKKIMHKPK